MAVPDFVCQVKAQLDDRYKGSFHLGSTSQDLIDSALAMALAEINSEWQTSFEELLAELGQLDAEFGGIRTIARTRMQDALPITLSLRVQTWVQPLLELRDQLEIIRPNVEVIQFGGPVGDRRSFGEKADAVSRGLAARLHLRDPGRAWHNQRANLATYAAWLTSATGVLGKIGTDCALMAQMGEVWFSEAGNSSAMPHKSNPVAAEILITLARFNATLAAGMHGAVIPRTRALRIVLDTGMDAASTDVCCDRRIDKCRPQNAPIHAVHRLKSKLSTCAPKQTPSKERFA